MKNLPKTWQELKHAIESLPVSTKGVKITCACGRCKAPSKLTDEDYKLMFSIFYGSNKTTIDWSSTSIDDEMYIGTSETVINKRPNNSFKKDTLMT